jgi:hypothetical protein
MSPRRGSKPRRTDRLVVGRNVTLTLTNKDILSEVAGIGQQQYYWTEAVQVTNTDGRPDLSSEGAPYTDKTVNVKQ